MRWNWTQPDWPNFRYDRMLLKNSGGNAGCDAGRAVWIPRFTPALA